MFLLSPGCWDEVGCCYWSSVWKVVWSLDILHASCGSCFVSLVNLTEVPMKPKTWWSWQSFNPAPWNIPLAHTCLNLQCVFHVQRIILNHVPCSMVGHEYTSKKLTLTWIPKIAIFERRYIFQIIILGMSIFWDVISTGFQCLDQCPHWKNKIIGWAVRAGLGFLPFWASGIRN